MTDAMDMPHRRDHLPKVIYNGYPGKGWLHGFFPAGMQQAMYGDPVAALVEIEDGRLTTMNAKEIRFADAVPK